MIVIVVAMQLSMVMLLMLVLELVTMMVTMMVLVLVVEATGARRKIHRGFARCETPGRHSSLLLAEGITLVPPG